MRRALSVIFVGLLLLSGVAFWPGDTSSWVQIDVKPGVSATLVARRLVEKGLFYSVYPMIFWTKVMGADQKIKMGRYRFSKGRSAFWVVRDFITGRTLKIHFTIPEGFASWQMAEQLDFKMVCPAPEFKDVVAAQKLEGYLFPATYDLDVGMDAKEVASIFLKNFDRVWTEEMEARAKTWGWTQREAVTLASILEREIMDRRELPLVSAVYHNRLKRRMRLEADPTVQFALGYWKKRILYADINNTKSAYNTYLHLGLPPGPICNPGKDSLTAALWPADSDVLYFVATEDGHHDFSKTFKEHSQKVKTRDQIRKKKR